MDRIGLDLRASPLWRRWSVDGDHGCALIGANLQEGEAEFVQVAPRDLEPVYMAETRACYQAFHKLLLRLGLTSNDCSYAWDPRRPGSAG